MQTSLPVKNYTIYLDYFLEDLFFELESVSDGGTSHQCTIKARTAEEAASKLSTKLVPFFTKQFNDEED